MNQLPTLPVSMPVLLVFATFGAWCYITREGRTASQYNVMIDAFIPAAPTRGAWIAMCLSGASMLFACSFASVRFGTSVDSSERLMSVVYAVICAWLCEGTVSMLLAETLDRSARRAYNALFRR